VNERVQALVILPVLDMPSERGQQILLAAILRSAQDEHHCDLGVVYDFPSDRDEHLESVWALEEKWRPRAATGVPDHATGELADAGFLEVAP
jgi:hypothetical protein